jgi:hypothetical protein
MGGGAQSMHDNHGTRIAVVFFVVLYNLYQKGSLEVYGRQTAGNL